MKTLTIVAYLSALVAFVATPLSLEISGSLLMGAGLLCLLVGDYSRPVRSLRPAATVLKFSPAGSRPSALELAA
jgi:hypothetical protein